MLHELLSFALSHFEESVDSLPLPPKFSSKDADQIRAWRHAIVDSKKIKTMAALLRKSPGGNFAPKRVINNIPDEALLAIFFRSHDNRVTLARWFSDNGKKFTGLYELHPSMVERVTRRELVEETRLSDKLLGIIEEEELDHLAENMEFLKRCASQNFYQSISEPLRDTLDLALNLLLALPGTERFTSVFLASYPWLAVNQPAVEPMDVEDDVQKALENEQEADPKPFDQSAFREFVQHHARALFNNARPGDNPWGIVNYHEHFTQKTILSENYRRESENFFNATFAKEHEGVIEGFSRIFTTANNYKVFDTLNAWKVAEEKVVVTYDIPVISVSSEKDIHAIGFFLQRRNGCLSENFEFLREFQRSLKKMGKDVSRLTEMTINQTGSLDEILELTQSIAATKGKCMADAEAFLEIVGEYLDAFREVCAALNKQVVEGAPVEKSTEVLNLEQMLAETTGKLKESEASVSLLNDQLKQAYLSLESEKDRRVHQEAQTDSLKTALHEARSELQARAALEGAQAPAAQADADLSLVLGLLKGDIKRTPLMILETFSAIYPDRLVILDSARKSALAADNFNLPDRLAQLLDTLINPYLDSIRSGQPDAKARTVLPQSYAAKESDTVMKSPRLRAMREFTYEGEPQLFIQHVGVGRNYGTQHSLRIYFRVINEKLVIAYCGEHLENASTN
ncbi:hypothetical protein DV532_29415 (plasmid) [Pseudomonas sp. Leaf58]|uniref:hypothetical protein n=1 Tax=Pseudomonas sp. Leaf58 TaxID=1736226 RepID=UPI0006F4B0D1|nr:hypothetical protein [Pseudomonas sp. Leaf58]AYG48364.1 hypothetical protein DV532_29415 [Pseudomonas sp. Leaf58]KQN62091.1 hypothetical protein ASF02_07885 [Pseudomonas sp. Leaf58]